MTDLELLLQRAGLTRLSDEDRERLARQVAVFQEQLAELRIPEARYAEPATRFRPTLTRLSD